MTEPHDIDDDEDAERRRKPHARINKNLLNRPLARDCRVKADWRFSKKHARWWCNLPGTKYIRYRLPSDAQLRLPDGFDVAVLFLILRQARMSKSRKVTFTSRAAMLRKLGRPVRVRYRRRLEQSLTLWSQISIRWERWYREAQYSRGEASVGDYGIFTQQCFKTREGTHVRLVLPPPIERLRSLNIVVAQAWLKYGKFECKVGLPLPIPAAVQNVVLALLANPTAHRTLRAWCRTAGLNYKARNRRLRKIVPEVSKWFEQHKGEMVQLVERFHCCATASGSPRPCATSGWLRLAR